MARLREGRANTARGAAHSASSPSAGPGRPSSLAPWPGCVPFPPCQPDGSRPPLTRRQAN